MRSRVEILENARHIILNQLKKTEDLLANSVSLRKREQFEVDCEILRLIDELILEELRKELA